MVWGSGEVEIEELVNVIMIVRMVMMDDGFNPLD